MSPSLISSQRPSRRRLTMTSVSSPWRDCSSSETSFSVPLMARTLPRSAAPRRFAARPTLLLLQALLIALAASVAVYRRSLLPHPGVPLAIVGVLVAAEIQCHGGREQIEALAEYVRQVAAIG